MKMKKLTALALAGVLCLGMSVTAFADEAVSADGADGTVSTDGSPSPSGEKDGKETVQFAKSNKEEGTVPVTVGAITNHVTDGWEDPDPDQASKNIKSDFKSRIRAIEDQLNEDDGDLSPNERQELEAQLDNLNQLNLGKDAYYEVVTAYDYSYDLKRGEEVTIRFNLNDRLEDLAEGDDVYLMHYVDGQWQVYSYTVQYDPIGDNGKPLYYVEHPFTHFSPVAIVRVTDDGTPSVEKPEPKPENPTEDPTLTPNADGSITADQLADLIVKKLEQNANTVKVVRTAVSGKASPKTGE